MQYTMALFLAASAALAADPPAVANRDPKSDEWGYRPADGSVTRLNPPSFTWIHDERARAYDVQWAARKDFSDAVTVTGVPWCAYTHSAPLAPATYYWRYRFADAGGRASTWSRVRSVAVPREAVEFPMPTRAQQRERVPAGHPRLFLRPDDLPRLRAAATGACSKAFARLRGEADRFIAAGPTPEPEHMGSARDKENAELVKYWWPNREQAQRACQEAETLAFVALISGEAKYREAARRWILHLAAWDPDGPTNFGMNCEAGKVMLYRPARAYDWAWDTLADADRAKVRQVMKRRVDDAWKSGEIRGGNGHLTRPYNSHGNRIWHKVGESGVAFLGEIPEAETWLDYAVNKFYACYPVWSDDDGGWHEGVSYWAGYMGKAVGWLQYARSALAIDGFQKPFFAQVGDYPMYIAPPGSPTCGFGDLSYRPPSSGIGGMLEYFVRAGSRRPGHGHAGYWRWWMERWGMKGEGGILGFLYDAHLPDMPAAKAPTDVPPSKVFHGIGVASLHVSLLDSRDDVHFLMKSSPFGSQSHGHNPQNSFQLNAYGEALLTACGYRDLHGSKFHYQWVHATRAQNAVLVDGEGQIPHSVASQGRIAAEQLAADFDYVCGDALPAYGGRLTRARRHAVLVKSAAPFPFVVLFDELAAPRPATFQFMLHALKPFVIDEPGARLAVEQPKAGVVVQYLCPAPLAFRQWDGFDPKPKRDFPNMWHVEAGTKEKAGELGMLTVLVPHRAGQAPAWKAVRVESPTAVGARVEVGGKPVRVLFRTAGAAGSAAADGVSFDGPVAVR